MCVQGTEPQSSGRAASALNHAAISVVPSPQASSMLASQLGKIHVLPPRLGV
ncbi:hypothetical protein LEMLEM_LOCUS12169 [Lemmus lemmus]